MPTKPAVPSVNFTGNCDLLSNIMASQEKLKDFGKTSEPWSWKEKEDSNANRMRAAIIASRLTLDRLNEDRRQRKIALNDATDYGAIKNFRIPKLPKCCPEEEESCSQNLRLDKSCNTVKTPGSSKLIRKSEDTPEGKKKMKKKLEDRRQRMVEKLRSDTQVNLKSEN